MAQKTRAFIIKVAVDEGADVMTIAGDIQEAVEADGLVVTEPVMPWSAPTEIAEQAQTLLGSGSLLSSALDLGLEEPIDS